MACGYSGTNGAWQGARLERLDPISATFPENGRERLARAQEAREGCERQWAAQIEKLTRLRQRRDELEINYPLLEALPALRRMAERQKWLPAGIERPASAGRSPAARSGRPQPRTFAPWPDWSCDRIRATDRSLFAREDIERQGREMRAAASAHQAAVDSLTQSNREVENAEREVASNTAALDLLPAPPPRWMTMPATTCVRPLPGRKKPAASAPCANVR